MKDYSEFPPLKYFTRVLKKLSEVRSSIHPIMEEKRQAHESCDTEKRCTQGVSYLANNVQESACSLDVSESYSLRRMRRKISDRHPGAAFK